MRGGNALNSRLVLSGLLAGALLLFLSGCRYPHPAATTGDSLEVGVAEVDITPPIGFRMAGYFDERRATGVHDPLHAKALVLKQGDTQLGLVFCDLLGLSLNVTTNARALASVRTGIPVANLVICATHSHTGPLFDDIRDHYFHIAAVARYGTDAAQKVDYPAFLTARLVEVIKAAQANLRPAELDAGIARQEGVAFNRRYWMKNGKVVFNPGQLNTNIVRPAGPTDPDVGILLARDRATRQPFTAITVFALHSDTVGGTKYSADYEYYLEQTLQHAFGTNFVSAYGLGTCGDLNHINVARKEPTSGFDVAQRIGSTLGATVLKAAPNLAEIHKPVLAAASTNFLAELQPVTREQVAEAAAMVDKLGDAKTDFYARVAAVKILDLARRGSTCPMEVQVFRLNADTAIVCLPGEIFVELGLAIKQASPFKTTLVLSICNDRPSYVPTRKAFEEGSYEVSNSRVQPGTGETLVAAAVDLLRLLKTTRGK